MRPPSWRAWLAGAAALAGALAPLVGSPYRRAVPEATGTTGTAGVPAGREDALSDTFEDALEDAAAAVRRRGC